MHSAMCVLHDLRQDDGYGILGKHRHGLSPSKISEAKLCSSSRVRGVATPPMSAPENPPASLASCPMHPLLHRHAESNFPHSSVHDSTDTVVLPDDCVGSAGGKLMASGGTGGGAGGGDGGGAGAMTENVRGRVSVDCL